MTKAIYAGSFDPLTNGHLDILLKASKIFDEVVLLFAINVDKVSFFPLQDRMEQAKKALSEMPGVTVDSFDGLLVKYAGQVGASALIRGIRMSGEFDYEFQMASINARLNPNLTTLYFMPAESTAAVSSSIVRQLWRFDADYASMVPASVLEALKQKPRD
jgi:pantetheine-phosphate adenylyltransferase